MEKCGLYLAAASPWTGFFTSLGLSLHSYLHYYRGWPSVNFYRTPSSIPRVYLFPYPFTLTTSLSSSSSSLLSSSSSSSSSILILITGYVQIALYTFIIRHDRSRILVPILFVLKSPPVYIILPLTIKILSPKSLYFSLLLTVLWRVGRFIDI